MNEIKKAVEKLYTGMCTVTEYVQIIKPNKTTAFQEKIVMSNIPCRLSFKTLMATKTGDTSGLAQTIKVFLAPELHIKPGSKLTITQNGVTTDYQRSGVPAVYPSHQEIVLELYKEYA